MPRYSVSLPITGYLIKEVEADSEQAAIEAALSEPASNDDIEEWETTDAVVTGNVFHGKLNRASAHLIED